MYSYRIRGDNYDTIIVDVYFRGYTLAATQYYSKLGTIVGKDDVSYIVSMNNNLLCLDKIVTNATDTVQFIKSNCRCFACRCVNYCIHNTILLCTVLAGR